MGSRTLRTFSASARTLSFTRAAATLGYAQSSVTARMKTLEEPFPSKTLALEKQRGEEILILAASAPRLAKAGHVSAHDRVQASSL